MSTSSMVCDTERVIPTLPESAIADLIGPYLPDPPAALLPRLSAYLDLLLKWNARTNLTAIREPEEIVRGTSAKACSPGVIWARPLPCSTWVLAPASPVFPLRFFALRSRSLSPSPRTRRQHFCAKQSALSVWPTSRYGPRGQKISRLAANSTPSPSARWTGWKWRCRSRGHASHPADSLSCSRRPGRFRMVAGRFLFPLFLLFPTLNSGCCISRRWMQEINPGSGCRSYLPHRSHPRKTKQSSGDLASACINRGDPVLGIIGKFL